MNIAHTVLIHNVSDCQEQGVLYSKRKKKMLAAFLGDLNNLLTTPSLTVCFSILH